MIKESISRNKRRIFMPIKVGKILLVKWPRKWGLLAERTDSVSELGWFARGLS